MRMRRLVGGEFRKLFSTRLWLWLLLAAAGITALYAALTIGFADTPDAFTPPLTTAEGQRTLLAVGAGGAPLVAVLGAIGITGEFRHRTATATFLATPSRGQVVVAKLIAYAVTGAGYALACTAVTLAIALPWLAAKHIHLVVGGGALVGTVTGVTLALAIFGPIGVGVGALLREQVSAVLALLLYLLLVERILTSIGALNGWTLYLPGQAQEALIGSTLTDQDLLSPWQGGLLLAAYGLALATAGTFLALRKDVT